MLLVPLVFRGQASVQTLGGKEEQTEESRILSANIKVAVTVFVLVLVVLFLPSRIAIAVILPVSAKKPIHSHPNLPAPHRAKTVKDLKSKNFVPCVWGGCHESSSEFLSLTKKCRGEFLYRVAEEALTH